MDAYEPAVLTGELLISAHKKTLIKPGFPSAGEKIRTSTGLTPTWPSTMRVCQFRHTREASFQSR